MHGGADAGERWNEDETSVAAAVGDSDAAAEVLEAPVVVVVAAAQAKDSEEAPQCEIVRAWVKLPLQWYSLILLHHCCCCCC